MPLTMAKVSKVIDFLAELTAARISGKKESPLGRVVTWLLSCQVALAAVASFCLKSADLTVGAWVPRLLYALGSSLAHCVTRMQSVILVMSLVMMRVIFRGKHMGILFSIKLLVAQVLPPSQLYWINS